jgi:hypothetical protein
MNKKNEQKSKKDKNKQPETKNTAAALQQENNEQPENTECVVASDERTIIRTKNKNSAHENATVGNQATKPVLEPVFVVQK